MAARVMPVAIKDQTGDFVMQMAQGNQALARLYTQLLAQYEARREAEAFRREMADRSESIGDRRRDEANDEWYNRTQFAHNLRYGPGGQQEPNLLGPGAGSNPLAPGAPQQQPPPSTLSPKPAGAAARPSVYTIDNNPFSKGAGVNAPATPAPQASAGGGTGGGGGGLVEEISSQSRGGYREPDANRPPRTFSRESRPSTQLPTQPRVGPRTAPKPQAAYLDIDQRWIDLMHSEEDKYKLPRGALMTLYGVENGGGRQFGQNKNSSAIGIYQFTQALRDEHGLSTADTLNPAKMIPAAAMNLRRNADMLAREHKVQLPTTSEAMPLWSILHQYGVVDGPRIVAAYLQNPDAPMAEVMAQVKNRDGTPRNNYNVMVQNNLDPTWTVKQAIQANKASPWLNAYIKQFPDHANQPTGQYKPTPVPAYTPQVNDPTVPRPPGSIPPQQHGTMGTNPRLVAAVRGGADLALPEGYTIRQTSGARPGGSSSSHHHRGNAGDFQIYKPDGTPLPNRGEDTTGLYTRLARGVKSWVRENDPELERRIGYGGAFGTQLGGGGVPDLMHFDLGGSRGRMRPEVQFARLQPLGTDERRTQVAQTPPQAPQQQPVKVAAATPPEREVMPAISRIPTSGEVAATFDNKIANAGFAPKQPQATPPVAALDTPPPLSQPIKPGASGVAARSDIDYNVKPDMPVVAELPMPPERPQTESGNLGDLAAGGTPADAEIPGDEYGSYAALPIPPARPIEPEITQADRTAKPNDPSESVQDAMADAFKQRTDPTYQQDAFVVDKAPTQMPPQLAGGIVPKQPLDPLSEPMTPPQRMPVGDAATARDALPPEFTLPPRGVPSGQAGSAAASAPSGVMPRDVQLPPNLPRQLEPEVVSGNAPTVRSIIDAIYSGKLPNMSTVDPYAPPKPPVAPRDPSADPYKDYIRSGDSPRTLEQVGEWLKQHLGPRGQPENQKIFNAAMQDYVRRAAGGVTDWWNRPKADPTAKPTTQSPPPKMQERMMPGGGAYLPSGVPPLVVKPRGNAPGNTTLSAPTQGGTGIPPAPGLKINPATGRPDVPAPVIGPDGVPRWPEPGEAVVAE